MIYRQRPLVGAEIAFHPQFEGPGWIPVATATEDGSFAASTKRTGDGALPGSYKVTVLWRPSVNDEGPNLLPPRYANPATTPLTIEVRPGADSPHTLTLTD